MARHQIKKKIEVQPDSRFNSVKLQRFINYIMQDGKRTTAQKVVYSAFDIIKEKTKNPNPLEIFDLAIKNASPAVEVRSRRIGGANYQVPKDVRTDRRLQLAMRWIVQATKSGKGKPMRERVAEELISASKNEGVAVKKKEDTHRMAEANKAFAHFSW